MSRCYSGPECCNLFSGVKLSKDRPLLFRSKAVNDVQFD